jgi:acetyl esterase
MPLHPTIAGFLATLPPSDATAPNVEQWRAQGEEHVPPLAERLPLLSVEDSVASFGGAQVPVRVYTSVESDAQKVLLYLHGGAFFSGSLETHDAVARSLAKATGYRVVSVGYRLAPEHAYPAGLDDCYTVLRWIIAGENGLEWDCKTLVLAGDSSGGTFVAALTTKAKDEGLNQISAQVLFYPSVDLDFDETRYASLVENGKGYGLETIALKPHNSFYVNSGASPADPLVSPIKRADLSGLPKALVVTAEFDPLRDEGEAYAERLKAAGVPVKLIRYDGATHGFVQYWSWLPEFAPVFQDVADFLG